MQYSLVAPGSIFDASNRRSCTRIVSHNMVKLNVIGLNCGTSVDGEYRPAPPTRTVSP
jgi:hypothetical protein